MHESMRQFNQCRRVSLLFDRVCAIFELIACDGSEDAIIALSDKVIQ